MIKQTLKKCALVSAIASSVFALSPTAQASVAETLFDKYTINTPGTRNTNRGTVFYGGAFNARIDQNPTELVGFQAPSISGGCGGIDMFAGSFSLVSKDEVVQMLRGVAQGVPAYFFNLALSNVCADCSEIATELENRVAELNKWGRTSCETFAEMGRKAGTEMGILSAKAKSEGANEESTSGLSDGPFSWLTKQIPSPSGLLTDDTGLSQETLEKIADEKNRLGILIDDISSFDFPYVLGNNLNERKENLLLLLTALGGNTTANIVSDRLEQESKGKTVTVSILFEGAKEAESLYYYQCVTSTPSTFLNDACADLSIVAYDETSSFYQANIGFATNLEELIFGNVASGEVGIVDRLLTKTDMSADQERLLQMTSYNFIPLAATKQDNPALHEVYKGHVLYNLKTVLLRDFETKITILLNTLRQKAKARGEQFIPIVDDLQQAIMVDINTYRTVIKTEAESMDGALAMAVADRQV